jgi:xylulokinase
MYILGVDVGTTGTKSMLIDGNGNLIRSAYSGYPLLKERMGFIEQNADDWWKAFITAVRECVAGIEDKRNILALSMSTQGGLWFL